MMIVSYYLLITRQVCNPVNNQDRLTGRRFYYIKTNCNVYEATRNMVERLTRVEFMKQRKAQESSFNIYENCCGLSKSIHSYKHGHFHRVVWLFRS